MEGRLWRNLHCIFSFKLFWCIAYLAVCVNGQAETTDSQPLAKKLEETVVTDMLKIVDNKFDTLTTRITALERAVSNLQFYSIRQFRQINGRLQNSENGLEAVSKQVGQLEVDGRGMKISLSLLSRDVTELKSSSTGILGELESSVTYINENIDKQMNNVKTYIDDAVSKMSQESFQTISKQLENLTEIRQKEMEHYNCTVDLSSLYQYIDSKIGDLKLSTQNYFEAASKNIKNLKNEENSELIAELSVNMVNENEKDGRTSRHSPSRSAWYNISTEQNEMDEQVMSALTNMTSSVLQAVSYLRNTGGLLEQIASNTDLLISSQSDFTQKLKSAQYFKNSQTDRDDFDVPNTIPGAVANDGYSSHFTQTAWQPFPRDIAWKLANLIQNGSQLLEVLTDLAQLSSVSLTQATAALNDEVKQVEGIKTSLITTFLAKTSGDDAVLNSVKGSQTYRQATKGSISEANIEDRGLYKESLEAIYSTSLELNRIMPALTKLLAEPDPLITLVGGGRADQGRVEIYHKGHWGILCHNNLTHSEADIICRHLGFRGGISAGAGQFGAGTGIAWNFNASCLASSLCSIVNYTESTAHCHHEMAASVICDHMLRIVSIEGSKSNKVGRLEIHHRGMWLPICSEGWSGFSSQVACKQMGFLDGREIEMAKWEEGSNTAWLSKVSCIGNETRLDACDTEGWMNSCAQQSPAGVRCL
ncbi:hypothetical protein Btru_061246 [Bulinus truncatus]|nr:hypothetical protein Btru_061246 [Bulinus truncatus]